ncbi:SHIRT domain-containing protein [Parvimonas micra]
MKKFISKVLICAMLISVLPKTSFAHEEKINTTTVSEEQKAKTEKVEKKEEVKAEKKVEKKEEAKAEEKVEKKEEVKAEEKVEKKEEVKAEEKVEKKEETKAEEKSERKEEVKTETKLEQSVIASPIKARATEPRYSVEFHFDPIPDSKQLPQAIIDKLPEDKTNVEDGTVINLPSFADEVVEDKGGFWKFIGWEMFPVIRSTRNLIDGNTVTVNGSDLVIIGKWGFEASYFVEYAFKSITAGKELPEDVLVKLPEKQTGIPAETEITLPEMTDVKVEGGTWKFVRWSWGAYYRGTRDDGQDQSVFVDQDLLVTGEWEYVEDPEPEKYDVTFTFKSITPGKELADEVKAKTPANKLGVENETVIFLEKYADVKVIDGTWKFVKWQLATGPAFVDVEDEVTVNGADLNLTGLWKFEPDPEKYNVTFHFVTLTLGKELPTEVLTKKPANQSDLPSGTVIPLPKFEDVKVKGGTWKFLGWYSIKGAEHNKVENKVVVDNDNLYLLGQWKFEADKKPQPKPQKPKVQKGRILPKTNVESAFTYVVLALAGIGGAYIAKKKDNE